MFSPLRCSFSRSKGALNVIRRMAFQEKVTAGTQIPLESIIPVSDSPAVESKTVEFCKQYSCLPKDKKLEVLKQIVLKCDFDSNGAKKAAESFLSLQDKGVGLRLKAADRLKASLNPKYTNIFSQIRKLDGGVKFLVHMRADLLNILPTLDSDDASTHLLKSLNMYLRDILSFSFNVGFLALERITWDSSCDMLQKISEYEAVHPVRNWTDLKQRVGPYRRCYVFTHSSMCKEPIVVLHTALTNDISSNIVSIVRQNRLHSEGDATSPKVATALVEDPKKIQAAVFYSITSTQKGLHGIDLGNQLIKKVVREVLVEFPHIVKLSTLSPIPGFREWLLMEIRKMTNGDSPISSFFSEHDISNVAGSFSNGESSDVWSNLGRSIVSNKWIKDSKLTEYLKTPLMKICAHYLYTEKRRSNALNSVANFHLRNGAVLWRLNWAADLSPRGLDNSCGMMVNYRYYINETETNSKRYIEDHHVAISDDFKLLLTPVFNRSSL